MNKSKVAVAVVVGLGILWTGGAWYTGKQTEQHIDEVVAQLNQQITARYPNAGLVLSQQGYQRHLFSSETQFVLKSTLPATDENALLAPNESLVFNEKISHGPLPLAQLKHFNFLPALASVHTELANTPNVKAIFAAAQGKSPFSAETRIGYNKSTSSAIHILPIDYQAPDNGIRSDSVDISLKTAPSDQNLVLDVHTGNVILDFKNEEDADVQLLVNGLNLSSDSRFSKEGVRVGTQNIQLANFQYTLERIPALQVNDLQGSSDLTSKNSLISGGVNYQVGAIKWHQLPLGSASLKLSLNGFDAQGVKTFFDAYNQAVQRNMANLNQVTNPDELQAMQNEVNAAVLQNVPVLLKGAPTFSIDNFSLKNDKGESHFTLNANFNDPSHTQPETSGLARIVDSYVKQLTAHLSINTPMATELVNVIAQSQGATPAEATQFAQQQVSALTSMGEMYHLTTTQGDKINSDLGYTQGEVTVNHNKLSLEQFIEQYLSSNVGDQ